MQMKGIVTSMSPCSSPSRKITETGNLHGSDILSYLEPLGYRVLVHLGSGSLHLAQLPHVVLVHYGKELKTVVGEILEQNETNYDSGPFQDSELVGACEKRAASYVRSFLKL